MNARRFGLRLHWWSVVVLAAARAAPAQALSCPTLHVDPAAATESWAPPLDRIMTAHANEMSLRDALDRVAALAKLRVSYSADLLPLSEAVCLSVDKMPVGRILANLLAGTSVSAVGLGGDQVVLAPRRGAQSQPAEPQMATSLGMLDRVVVTGSMTNGAPARELSVGLNVLDGRTLSRDNTTTLSGALDDYAPGVWSWAQSPSTLVSSYASIRGASSFGLSYPKIYIDGIEVANPLLFTRFNPSAIDHIEVIRGPQGSALYGTDAISGVVNIVTRHDGAPAEGGDMSLRSTVGMAQSAWVPSGAVTQNHSLSIAKGTSARSANLYVSAGSMGSFIPDSYSRELTASSSGRLVGAKGSLTATARLFVERAGTPSNPLVVATTQAPGDTTSPQSVSEYTFGVTGTRQLDTNWTFSVVTGVDGYRLKNVQASSFTSLQTLLDSALHAAEGGADRYTLRASTVYQLHQAAPTHASLTFSVEHATLRLASLAPPLPTDTAEVEGGRGGSSGSSGSNGSGGSSSGSGSSGGSGRSRHGAFGETPNMTATTTQRLLSWQNSTGLVAQTNVALHDMFFVTGGVRFEHDSRLVGTNEFETLPMVGASMVTGAGPFEVKLRTAYGKGIRPPSTPTRMQFWETLDDRITTQGALGPERQSGIESGIDLFLRHALAVQVTRFDQRASGLIQLVGVPDATRHYEHLVPVAQNVGEISNRGWELQATGNIHRLAVNGTMTIVDSRVRRLADGYTGDLILGDRILQVPAQTQSLTATWTERRWRLSGGMSRALDWINYDRIQIASDAAKDSIQASHFTGPYLRQYWKNYDGGARLRASASRDFRNAFTFEISGENLLNHQTGEPDNATIIPGRTISTGIRLKF